MTRATDEDIERLDWAMMRDVSVRFARATDYVDIANAEWKFQAELREAGL